VQYARARQQQRRRKIGGGFVKDKMSIVIVLVVNLSLRGREIKDLVFRVQGKRAFIRGCTV
jgi:hypothetical protein